MPSLVSPDDVAKRCPNAADHDQEDLQLIIDANEAMMNGFLSSAAQSDGSATIRVRQMFGRTVMLLPERVASITSVVEHWLYNDSGSDLTLDPTDYRLAPDGTALERLPDGVHQRPYFADELIITYVGGPTESIRKNVLLQLVCYDVGAASAPGGNPNVAMTGRRLGDYSEQFGQGSGATGGINEDKQRILDQLVGTSLPIFA